tara:strand:- start:310 stop:462 length:153 start_codon:yes stop_codon:yes gene_type:complete
MNEFKNAIVNLVEALPPLLQLILGMALALGFIKMIIIITNIIETKKGKDS